MPRRDGQRIWKILKKIQLSSDHGVEKLGLTMVLRSWVPTMMWRNWGPTMVLRSWVSAMEAARWVLCHLVEVEVSNVEAYGWIIRISTSEVELRSKFIILKWLFLFFSWKDICSVILFTLSFLPGIFKYLNFE